MVTVNNVVLEDEELMSYRDSFLSFQNMLLNEENFNNDNLQVLTNILAFMKAGTKPKRKKNFKAYFENIDINKAKDLTDLLQELKVAVESGELESINKQKNELITQGMLLITKSYLEMFSLGRDSREVQDTKNFDTTGEVNVLHNYSKWLYEEVNDLVTEMADTYQNSSLNQDLVRKFVYEFKRFLNGRLLLKIIDIGTKQIIGVPIQLTKYGYKILPHPFLKSEWELSRPIETLNNKERIKVGDIIAVNFAAVRNEHFISSLLYVDFDGAEVVPQTLHQALLEYVDTEYIEKAYEVFEVKKQDDEMIKSLLTKKLLDTSAEVRQLLSDDLNQLNEIREAISKQNEKITEAEETLEENRKDWNRILKRIDELVKIDELDGSIRQVDNSFEKLEYIPEQFISNLQSLFYHNDNQHLIYKLGIIKSFVYALQANILTILAGPSGTGKSSIVHAFASAVENVEVRMIPVQTSWTDTQDLLGYFHPMDKAFVPTPFMEALAEAAMEENKSKLFLICLDEMNLAHIEYYFSEILSAREEKTQSLRLYPKRHWNTAKIILTEGTASLERQQNARELIDLYPPVFRIPENVRFIGTLNMDHTVKPLSPKVIDRSFIMEINHLTFQEKEDIKSNLQKLTGKIKMNYELFEEFVLDAESISDAIEKIEEISLLFKDFPNASLNSRGYKHIRNFLSYTKDEIEKNEMIDFIILGKILPRIEIKRMEIDSNSNTILQKLLPYPLSYEKFNRMLNTKHTVNFW
ncbi:AAA family ATPase [Ureibacillus aquaedulcis]|uniref:AAA family ATPase n=1 Tax=Ureibacillus aquaedulcis TaxID=3058421 RepID=A0ABT8GNW3_9BACL|nr:AAA family ATPase [Ureibacillus sp. BA0131]MDN4493093.1 AAA family ATPase [Ureibacillus sp. BA0131]